MTDRTKAKRIERALSKAGLVYFGGWFFKADASKVQLLAGKADEAVASVKLQEE